MDDDGVAHDDHPVDEDEPAASEVHTVDTSILPADAPSPMPTDKCFHRGRANRSLIKRPRGRPPLMQSTDRSMSGSAISRMALNKHTTSMIPVKVSSSQAKLQLVNTITTSAAAASFNPSSYHARFSHPSYEEVAHKLLSFLMISEPMTAADLYEEFCEVPEDMIISMLEVLNTLGVVIKAQSRDSPKMHVEELDVYALTDFCKFSSELSYQQIAQETAQKLLELQIVKGRIRKLEDLTSLELTIEERTRRLSDLLQAFVGANPELRSDNLYDELIQCFEQPDTDSI